MSVDFSRHKITLPNVPFPRTFKNSKFSNVFGVCVCVCVKRKTNQFYNLNLCTTSVPNKTNTYDFCNAIISTDRCSLYRKFFG